MSKNILKMKVQKPREVMPRPAATGSSTRYAFHPDMLDETKTAPLMRGDVQEGVGALTLSDFAVNISAPVQLTARPALPFTEGSPTGKTILEKITPLNILLNELEPGYEVLTPIPVTIREADSSYVASFAPANVNASGDTWDEAVLNLESLLTDKLDRLLSHSLDALGPAPRQQLSVLQSFIRRMGDAQ